MRPVFIVALGVVLLGGCNLKLKSNTDIHKLSAKEAEAVLQGSWLIYEVGVKETDDEVQDFFRDTLLHLKNAAELTTLAITPGHHFITEDSLGNQTQRTWEFFPPNLIGFKHDDMVFEIAGLSDSTLTLDLRLDHKKRTVNVLLACYRVSPQQYGKALTDPSLNKWRAKPGRAEDPAAIAQRVVSLLQYNAVYLKAIADSRADYFNTRRFHLPFSYYNGGVGLRSFDSTSQFAGLFFNTENAREAYALLKENLNVRPYPRIDNYMLAYAAFFKDLGEVIALNTFQ
ncbi:hypothetical protein A8C56_05660 [Niabella ginsenosidivorans]|uniref:Uncharacterized protein n=1 Tax=Niabella ginsenosidivorans TaxID=1176587 RepID=A0A1A9I1V3_9BACT|nr:hypothetical protein [Niabella ginsenosidivorans]ANH80544.1 hypothetical protein A8C56_05660 [Niabella ginsenosidivorans]